MNNPGIDPSATQDIEMGHIDLDDEGGWPMGGIGANDDLTGDNAGHRQGPDHDTRAEGFYTLDYPGPAGQPIREAKTTFAHAHQANDQAGQAPWAPFADKDEWEFGLWMLRTLGHQQMDDLLKLNFVRTLPSLLSGLSYTFLKKVDSLPTGPGWTCEMVGLPRGPDGVEHEAELWSRNINECVASLLGNVDFQDHIAYKPTKIFKDAEMTERLYGEAWTADWWWETQAKLPIGATVAPVIVSTDKTRLTNLSGDQTAWPVYLSLGNISKALRRQSSSHSTIVIGYLPVSKMNHLPEVSLSGNLPTIPSLHASHLSPMENQAGGIDVVCGDGVVRRVYPILRPISLIILSNAWWLAAWKIAALAALFRMTSEELLSTLLSVSPTQLSLLCEGMERATPLLSRPLTLRACARYTTRNISLASLTLVYELIGEGELDARFKAIPGHRASTFQARYIGISQWTGKEHKAMEMVFLGAIAASDSFCTDIAIWNVLWRFSCNKTSLIDLGVRRHFNIPKTMLRTRTVQAIDETTFSDDKMATAAGGNARHSAFILGVNAALVNSDQDCGDSEELLQSMAEEALTNLRFLVTFDSYYIAKKSPYPGLHPGEIERVYNITGFLPTLTHSLELTAATIGLATANDRFDCFIQVSIHLPTQPWVASSPQNTKTIVRATPSRQSNNPRTPAIQPAQFDPAFVLEDPATESISNPGPPVRIARIRVIFRLPPHLDHSEPPHPHAFVEWYTPLGPVDPTTKMHHVSRATRNRQPHTAVICMTQAVYPPSDHGRAMDDPNTSMIAASASPEVQHVAAEPRRHQLEPRQPTVQSAPLPQELQTLQDMEWTKSDYSSPHVGGEDDGWQPGDLKGVPHSSVYTLFDKTNLQVNEDTPTLTPGTLTPPSPTETIMDVAAGEGLEINRDRQNRRQSNYLRIRQDRASVPSPNRYLQDTDDDVSVISNDEENDNFSERFFDADCEDDNGPRSLKTASGILLSVFADRHLD
ncbi:hypothetical protein BC826DRAFT_1106244 [Russula brevipes]|nr:hypothetical protein BC826DRAFT_1106244 [Russula brevipes]